jgi:hypothetical protein
MATHRSSQAVARQSTMSVGQTGGTSGNARLQAKRQELEGLQILKEQSARLAKDVEKLSLNIDQLVDGGEGEWITGKNAVYVFH